MPTIGYTYWTETHNANHTQLIMLSLSSLRRCPYITFKPIIYTGQANIDSTESIGKNIQENSKTSMEQGLMSSTPPPPCGKMH